jgi:DNA-binding transcriptional LysR family regulator
LLRELRKAFPRISPHLHEASQAQAEALLQKQELDLAITELDGKPAPGLKSLTLLRLPLALLLPEDSPIKTVRQLLARESLDDLPLIAFPESATITKLFQNDLRRQGRRWPVNVEVHSLDLVETYAAEGFGIGLSLALPESDGNRDRNARTGDRGLRRLPLGSGFSPLVVAALWQGRLAPLPAAFLELVKARAGQLKNDE